MRDLFGRTYFLKVYCLDRVFLMVDLAKLFQVEKLGFEDVFQPSATHTPEKFG